MAVHAASLSPKEVEAEEFGVGKGSAAPQEGVEPRPTADDGPLETSYGLDHPCEGYRPARKGLGKKCSVAVAPGEHPHNLIRSGGHLGRIRERLRDGTGRRRSYCPH